MGPYQKCNREASQETVGSWWNLNVLWRAQTKSYFINPLSALYSVSTRAYEADITWSWPLTPSDAQAKKHWSSTSNPSYAFTLAQRNFTWLLLYLRVVSLTMNVGLLLTFTSTVIPPALTSRNSSLANALDLSVLYGTKNKQRLFP